MASIRKISSGWQAQVARKGVRTSKTFTTKREAQDWAARQEHLIMAGEGQYSGGTLAEVLARYARTESPKKRGERWEALRLAKIGRDPIGSKRIKDITPASVAEWRDRRLKEVAPNTVRREMQLLSGVFTVAAKEWGILPGNPMRDVKKPSKPEARSRLVTDAEIEKLVATAGTDLSRSAARAVHAFRIGCATAMRAGEICALRPEDISGRVARLHTSKTGKGREVPLSALAQALWDDLPAGHLDMTPQKLDANFRKVRDAAKLKGLTFHDSRHRAITDLSKKVHVLSLAKIVGHDNVAQLMTYYDEAPEDIAAKLD